jgi:predicted aspartyl protease
MAPTSVLLLVAMASASATAPPTSGLQCQATSADGTCPDQVTFTDDDYDRMTVQVQVGGMGPYRFLVDTGANRSVVSSRLVQSLGLQRRGDVLVHSSAGISKVDMVRVPRIDLASRTIDGLEAPVLNADNMGADGILGVDTLRAQRIVIDFKNTQIYLTPSPRREPRLLPNEIVITGRLRSGHLIFTDASVDGEPVTAVVDTGAQLSMGNAALRRLLMRHRKLGRASPVQTISVTGQALNGDLHMVQAITLDDISVNGVEVMFADAETFRAIGREHKPTLLLGMNALRAFEEVAIDLDAKKLRLRIPRAAIDQKLDERALASR